MLRRRDSKASEAAVDLTPMIDMTFILLIFFMVSTTFVKDMKLDINRPGAQTQVVASTKAVRIYIDRQGETFLDGEPVRVWAIQGRVRDLLRGMTQKSVLVVADDQVPSGRLVEVVDQARLAGAEDVGVATVAEAGEG
ncbi:ExbD/TolR family protein [Rehaibacterium terrae]|jgi:biopolymer transport protein ExbD|uniref:Biopolymer transport protein ExbD n=1 Tax=Rehaibacterium terrae TaxID=1341696 RepID=A0A7W7Y1K8_9GAMM|nr:biopolymer transporter ExbD [Rehaibacterium terrae]MBB5016183.1 biopolymer transport protein ExbD [Rehaibacterium terrae]